MSTRRKSSNPCVLLAEGSVDTGVSEEPVPDTRSPVDHKGDEPSEGGTASEQSFYSRNIRGHKDFSQSEDSFRANDNDSLSCHYKGQPTSESQEQTIKSENDGFLQPSKGLGLFLHSSNSASEDGAKTPTERSSILEKGLEEEKELGRPASKDEIRAVSVNGTIIIPELSCHVTPLLQRPPNLGTSPAIAVPLHTSKYNPILDRNTTLITSFNRFPYPTQAELSWLTAASRHPEGQIKVWFTTQRLKQGISWSPEEVEEARKKMFNGNLAAGHQPCAGDPLEPRQALSTSSHGREKNSTVTVSLSSAACTPGIAAAVRQTLKRSLGSPLLASEVKRHAVAPPGDPKESLCMPPPPPPPTEPLAITSHTGLSDARTSSPDSFVASDVKRPAAEHRIPNKDKPPMVQFKEKVPVEAPSVLPKERLPLSPIVPANLRRSQIHQQMNSHASAVSSGPKSRLSCFGNSITAHSAPAVKAPQVNRAAVIQTLPAVPLSSLLQPAEPSVAPVVPCFNTYNVKEIPYGDRKHRFCDLSTICLNDSQTSCVELTHALPTQFPLLERLKDKSPGQMKLLEESFKRNSFLSCNEVEHLKITTGLSREDIESWFLERRALRDDLEQALLNSMGCKQESQQTLLNGAQRCSASFPFSPVPQDGKSTNLLKNVFVQSRWPSPVEMQTRLARTELVRWLRDSRLAQQSCVLDQKQTFEQRNGCRAADATRRPSPEELTFREDNKQPGSPETENLFGHTGSNGEEKPEDGDAHGAWKTRGRLSDSE